MVRIKTKSLKQLKFEYGSALKINEFGSYDVEGLPNSITGTMKFNLGKELDAELILYRSTPCFIFNSLVWEYWMIEDNLAKLLYGK